MTRFCRRIVSQYHPRTQTLWQNGRSSLGEAGDLHPNWFVYADLRIDYKVATLPERLLHILEGAQALLGSKELPEGGSNEQLKCAIGCSSSR